MQPPETDFGTDIDVPAAVTAIAAGRRLTPIWRNVVGGLTYRIDDDYFVKFAPKGVNLPLAQEAGRLAWAARWTPVPEVVSAGQDDTGAWLVTKAIDARSAVDRHWKAHPATAVKAIADGLRELHHGVPVKECPFDWSVERRLAGADRNPGNGAAWRRAATPPPIDRLVVCHGDPCAPNTLIGDDGRWRAHVDMATMGVADRWADLAVGSWSLSWNYGDGWEDLFFDTYGIAADRERIAYYRLLWDLG
ncbi:aminoglycoside 3'-phosphotransferase [Paractinoplanes durhamensis]|uniref:Phosphotransferase n=1 Tax=Paractinoplanes durhamensis TaxID=113563 RepID=A0ABQ3YSM0_9ACTN|nr:aminoglycoside 3'-phosphotransferase [Actinoplanes durhamensis]GIE00573.1 putative phosphotransferase [Actinoplanes durhamensis]